MRKESVSGSPLTRIHALRGIRTFRVQQRLAVGQSARARTSGYSLQPTACNLQHRLSPSPQPPAPSLP